jgi:hypothetical protein
MIPQTIAADDNGNISGLNKGSKYCVIELPPGAQIETHPLAGMAPGKVRSVISISAIEDGELPKPAAQANTAIPSFTPKTGAQAAPAAQ